MKFRKQAAPKDQEDLPKVDVTAMLSKLPGEKQESSDDV